MVNFEKLERFLLVWFVLPWIFIFKKRIWNTNITPVLDGCLVFNRSLMFAALMPLKISSTFLAAQSEIWKYHWPLNSWSKESLHFILHGPNILFFLIFKPLIVSFSLSLVPNRLLIRKCNEKYYKMCCNNGERCPSDALQGIRLKRNKFESNRDVQLRSLFFCLLNLFHLHFPNLNQIAFFVLAKVVKIIFYWFSFCETF